MNSRQTTYQVYLSHTTAQNNETNDCYKIWRNKRPKRSRSKKLLPKKDQKWWSGMSSNAKQKASSQFLSHVCCYQHWWRECEKTSTGEKKPPESQSLSGWYQQVRYKKVCTPQGRELKSEQGKKDKTRKQSWKLVPRRAPKNSSRFSQHSTRQRIEERARKERQNKKAILKISAVKSSEKLQPILSALGTRMQSTI